jgi:phosphoribosylformimino-5-aminoimidazole carboxamide ribotide isomerase
MASAVSVPVEVGGGIRTHDEMKTYLDAGIETVIVGTSAFQSPGFLEEASRRFPGRFAVALDTRGGKIVVKGWVDAISEEVETWLDRLNQLSLFAVIHTDVGRDGTQVGPNTSGLRSVLEKSLSPVIASGGVGRLEDLEKLRSLESEVGKSFYGVIIGRALYEEAFSLEEATRLLGDLSC